MQGALPASDRVKLTEYLSAIRDVEQRIQLAEAQAGDELPLVEHPAGIPADWEAHMKLMLDLQVLAYQCDLTRVITFMVGREHSGMTYPQIGVPDSHHPISHYAGELEKIEKVAKINAYHMKMFAYYLERLKATPDGDGTLLDHMTMMYGAGIADSNSHDPYDIPIVLAGKGHRLPEGRPAHPVQGHAAREPASDADGSVRRHDGQVRRQHRPRRREDSVVIAMRAKAIAGLCVVLLSQAGVFAAADARLINAIRAKDVTAVRTLLKQRVDVNAPEGDGTTALHWAAHVDDLTIADLLIQAPVRARRWRTRTGSRRCTSPASIATASMVERLLAAKADANAASINGETVLMTCARAGDARGVKALLVKGARVNVEGNVSRPDRADVGGGPAPS